MAIFRIRPGLRKSDPNPNSRRLLAVRCGARWRGRCKTSSCCLSRRCSAIIARTPPGPHSVAVMKRIGNSRRTGGATMHEHAQTARACCTPSFSR